MLPERLDPVLSDDASVLSPALAASGDAPTLIVCAPAHLRRAGMEMKMLIDAKGARKGKPDPGLVKLLVKAQKLKEAIVQGGDRLAPIIHDGHRI